MPWVSSDADMRAHCRKHILHIASKSVQVMSQRTGNDVEPLRASLLASWGEEDLDMSKNYINNKARPAFVYCMLANTWPCRKCGGKGGHIAGVKHCWSGHQSI